MLKKKKVICGQTNNYHFLALPLRTDKEKPHNTRLFGDDQCIVKQVVDHLQPCALLVSIKKKTQFSRPPTFS